MVGWTGKKDGRMDRNNGWMDGLIEKNRWMVGRTGKKYNHGQIDRKMDGWMARKNRWMGRMDGQKKIYMKKYMDGWMDGQKKYMDGWMDIKKIDENIDGWLVGRITKI